MYDKITKLAEKFEKVAADPSPWRTDEAGGYEYLWAHYDRLDSAMDELRSKLSSMTRNFTLLEPRSNDDAEIRAAVKKIQDEANKLSAKFEYWEGSQGRNVEAAALAAVKKTAATFEGRVAQMFKEEHRQVAGHEPSDVRVRAEFSRDENGDPSYPGSVTIWSDSYQPEYRITLENRMKQRLDPKSEGLYEGVAVTFFDPETGQEG